MAKHQFARVAGLLFLLITNHLSRDICVSHSLSLFKQTVFEGCLDQSCFTKHKPAQKVRVLRTVASDDVHPCMYVTAPSTNVNCEHFNRLSSTIYLPESSS